MEIIKNCSGYALPATLVAGAIFGLLTLSSIIMIPEATPPIASMSIDPTDLTIKPAEEFKIDVIVNSIEPVNAFSGVLKFDEKVLKVSRIDYNTSIADLWAQEPWFNKGEGTISFAGGSTRTGGFIGTGSLVTVYFTGISPETTNLKLIEPRILKHDGLGTDIPFNQPIDAVFTINPDKQEVISSLKVVREMAANTDLNNDGKTTIADISVFMLAITTGDIKADFNHDGKVTMADFSILLNNRQ